MNCATQNAACPADGCIYNITGFCLHALRPDPANCTYRYTASRLANEGLVTFSRRPSDRPAGLVPA